MSNAWEEVSQDELNRLYAEFQPLQVETLASLQPAKKADGDFCAGIVALSCGALILGGFTFVGYLFWKAVIEAAR